MKILRIEDKGMPWEYAKCMDTAMCDSVELKYSVRFKDIANAPIVIFTVPLTTWEKRTYILITRRNDSAYNTYHSENVHS